MESISNKIANKVASGLNMDEDKKEVIAYGTFSLLQIFLSIFLVSVIGYIFHLSIEALIVMFTGSILRQFSGGAHASTPGNCTTIGVIVCIGQAILLSALVDTFSNLNLFIIIELIVFVCAYYAIYKLAPVDNPAKPIKKKEKRERMKKISLIILSVYFILILSFMVIYAIIKEQKLLVYALCIAGGTAWQTFTLTKSGHLILFRTDKYLKYISNILNIYERRRK